jgi:hypothetical protein
MLHFDRGRSTTLADHLKDAGKIRARQITGKSAILTYSTTCPETRFNTLIPTQSPFRGSTARIVTGPTRLVPRGCSISLTAPAPASHERAATDSNRRGHGQSRHHRRRRVAETDQLARSGSPMGCHARGHTRAAGTSPLNRRPQATARYSPGQRSGLRTVRTPSPVVNGPAADSCLPSGA